MKSAMLYLNDDEDNDNEDDENDKIDDNQNSMLTCSHILRRPDTHLAKP